MNNLIDINLLSTLHKECIIAWKKSGVTFTEKNFAGLVEENHAFNYLLWHAEDRARRDDQGHEFVYCAKREIDKYNQERNNRMEAMDTWLYHYLSPSTSSNCPINSETPGMIIDRLSILSLKYYHMGIQASRTEADETHRQACQKKFNIIIQQQQQLYQCLSVFFHEIVEKTRTYRIYHQFKMYNDPALNPELYKVKE